MALINWPDGVGYAEFSEKPERARGPHVHRSAYTGAVHVSYGGGRRRRGVVVTPVQTRDGSIQPDISLMIQQISDPANQLRLERPQAVTSGTVTPSYLTAQVTRLVPPRRNERGVWQGWRIEWVAGAAAATSGGADTTAPTFVSAFIDGARLLVTYSETLDGMHVPSYRVSVDGVNAVLSGTRIAGATVVVTLQTAVVAGLTVTLTERTGGMRVRDTAGNEAARLGMTAVTNNT